MNKCVCARTFQSSVVLEQLEVCLEICWIYLSYSYAYVTLLYSFKRATQ